jgi:DNA-binding response OmpR family regulator
MSSVLVVDDDPMIADLVAFKLGPLGYDIQTAPDGLSGLELAHRIHPDLIMVDWMMPQMSGVEFCRLARDCELAEIPIILMTARTDPEDIAEGIRAGATTYLPKPVRLSDLATKISELLS